MAGGWRPLSKGDDEVSPARAFPHVSGKQGQLCKKIYDPYDLVRHHSSLHHRDE